MAEEKLLTIREASVILGISEKEVIELAEDQTLPAYKIGGVYLRFKRQQIESYRKTIKAKHPPRHKERGGSAADAVRDFFYFNDFYILSGIIIAAILLVILRGY